MKILDEANDALKNGQYKRAYNLYRAYLQNDKDNASALAGLAESLFHLNQFDEAFKIANESLSIQPDLARPHLVLGYLCARKRDWDLSVAEVKKALELEPEMENALVFLSSIFIVQNNKSEALLTIQRLFEINNKNWKAHFNLGCIYQADKNFKTAISEYQMAFRLKPTGKSLLRLIEAFVGRFSSWFILITLGLLFVTLRIFHMYWFPLLLCGLGILFGCLRVIVERDKRFLFATFLMLILASVYAILVYR